MTKQPTLYAAALLASLLAPALSVGAIAQTQTPVGGPATTPTPKPRTPKPASMTDRVEQHISQLHAQLHITPAQQAQWDQFAQVMRDNAHNMSEAMQQRGTALASMSAADDMQSYAQVAQQHAQDMQRLSTAFQALYASMSDEQKKNADTVFHARAGRLRHPKAS